MSNAPHMTPPAAAGGRKTKPGGYNPYAAGGVETISRRADIRNGVSTPQVATSAELRASAFANPLRVLSLLPDIDPLAAKSQANTLSLTCAPGDVQIVADKPSAAGAGDDSVDDAGTEAIEALFSALPQEVGGLKGLRKTLTLSLKNTGMAILECVPGPTGSGLSQLWPVDPLTCVFKRDLATGEARLYQRQGAEDVPLDPDLVLYVATDARVDDPYGRAKDAAALPAVLRNMALNQDLSDSVHNSAWKRLIYKYSLKQFWEIATDVLKLAESEEAYDPVSGEPLADLQGKPLTTHPAAEWVAAQMGRVDTYLANLNPDDNVTVDAAGDVDTIDGADLSGVEPVIKNYRLQVIQAYGDSPTMMGVDGPSFNFGSVAWAVQAQMLEDLRDDVLSLVVRAGSLHLKYLGKLLTARAKVKPIRTTDALVDAQAKQYEINNVLTMLAWGFLTAEQASIDLTGTGIPPEMAALVAARIEAMKDSLVPPPPPGQSKDSKNPASGDPVKPTLPAGSTAEERAAAGSAG